MCNGTNYLGLIFDLRITYTSGIFGLDYLWSELTQNFEC